MEIHLDARRIASSKNFFSARFRKFCLVVSYKEPCDGLNITGNIPFDSGSKSEILLATNFVISSKLIGSRRNSDPSKTSLRGLFAKSGATR